MRDTKADAFIGRALRVAQPALRKDCFGKPRELRAAQSATPKGRLWNTEGATRCTACKCCSGDLRKLYSQSSPPLERIHIRIRIRIGSEESDSETVFGSLCTEFLGTL